MEDALSGAFSNDRLARIFRLEQGRLRQFVRNRIFDEGDAEDILQDVFSQLVGAWLYRVARNRIVDFFRKKRPEQFDEDADGLQIEELLPSPDGGPEAALFRTLMWEELEDALDELPDEQREAFTAHEIEGRSFAEISEQTGVGVNTLISRKRYAVLHLRERLREIKDTILGEQP